MAGRKIKQICRRRQDRANAALPAADLRAIKHGKQRRFSGTEPHPTRKTDEQKKAALQQRIAVLKTKVGRIEKRAADQARHHRQDDQLVAEPRGRRAAAPVPQEAAQ